MQQSITTLTKCSVTIIALKGFDFEVDISDMPVQTAVCL